MVTKITKSTEQTVKFFEDFIRKDFVQDFILKLRNETGIPNIGVPFTDIDHKILTEEANYFLAYSPNQFKNKTWENYDMGRKMRIKIFYECETFIKNQGIESAFIVSMFRLYFYFNKTLSYYPKNLFTDDLLKLEEIDSMLFWYDPKNDEKIISFDEKKLTKTKREFERYESLFKKMKSISAKYPVALYINPEATQNQVKDFISKNWDNIKKYQTKKEISGIRIKRKQLVNDFIYKHRKLPATKIRRMLSDEMKEYLDDGNIRKIIQLQIKKRN